MKNLSQLNAEHLDFFMEIENIGASHAATALSTLLGRPVKVRVPKVKFLEFAEVNAVLGGPENLIVSLLVEMSGDLNGFILLAQDALEAKKMSAAIVRSMGMEIEDTGELLTGLQESALNEVANILSGAYLNALSELTGLSTSKSVPKMVIDMAGAIMNLPAAIYGAYGDVVLLMETEFVDTGGDGNLNGHFLMVPDVESFHIMLSSMGID
ncbi:MAG: chemotaxis protein CheC [Clostridiales bacterium]|nr:chemotaxis protein CheC [Clostridiales bacterium]